MSLLDSNIMVLSLLQTAKSQLDVLMQMAAEPVPEAKSAMLTLGEAFVSTVNAALKIREKITVAEAASVATSVA